MTADVPDEMLDAAMASWFGEDYEGGRLLGCAVAAQELAEDGLRDVLRIALSAAPKATEAPGLREALLSQVSRLPQFIADSLSNDGEPMVKLAAVKKAIRAALSATPQPVAEGPGLREAEGEPALWREMYTDSEWALLQAYDAAALSATPQPVAVPDDGAGRDGAWRYDIQYGPEGEANYAWVYDETGRMVGTMRTFHAATICAAASALSAERAAHEETKDQRLAWVDRAIVLGNRLDTAEAEVARLRKILGEIADTPMPTIPSCRLLRQICHKARTALRANNG